MFTDTDHIRNWRDLRRIIESEAVLIAEGCLLFPGPSIPAEVKAPGGPRRIAYGVSVIRVAWMLANIHDHLSPTDFAIHLCALGTDPQLVCVNPAHLRKGTAADIRLLKDARQRDLLLRINATMETV